MKDDRLYLIHIRDCIAQMGQILEILKELEAR
jgi:hypothetical protein